MIDLENIRLEVNLNPEQREYFDRLKAELLKFFGNKTYEEVLASEDLGTLSNVKLKLDQIIQFLKDKKIPQPEGEEDEPMWTPEEVIMWVREVFFRRANVEDFVKRNFKFDSPEWLYCYMEIRSSLVAFLPANLYVHDNLLLANSPIERLPKRLRVTENCDLGKTKISELPKGFQVGGYLYISHTQIAELPDDLYVGSNIFVEGLPQSVVDKAYELKRRGQIKGDVIQVELK